MRASFNDLMVHFDNRNFIYHYTSAETALAKILYNRRILFNSLSKMNDPMEFQDHPQMLSADFDMDRKHTFRIFEEIETAKKKRKELVRLACFCIDNFDNKQTYTAFDHHKGWARSRMWTQYAGNHTGVSLVFDRSQLIHAVEAEVKKRRLKGTQVLHQEVKYSNDVLEYEKAFSIDVSTENFQNDFSNFYLENKERFLFQKIEDYRDEQEYRVLLLGSQKRSLDVTFAVRVEEAIAGIVIGCAFSEAYYPLLKNYSEKLNIGVFRLNWEFGAPRLYGIFGREVVG